MKWISENVGTIIVAAALLAMIGAAVGTMIRDKKKGRSACGCGCSGCQAKCGCKDQ